MSWGCSSCGTINDTDDDCIVCGRPRRAADAPPTVPTVPLERPGPTQDPNRVPSVGPPRTEHIPVVPMVDTPPHAPGATGGGPPFHPSPPAPSPAEPAGGSRRTLVVAIVSVIAAALLVGVLVGLVVSRSGGSNDEAARSGRSGEPRRDTDDGRSAAVGEDDRDVDAVTVTTEVTTTTTRATTTSTTEATTTTTDGRLQEADAEDRLHRQADADRAVLLGLQGEWVPVLSQKGVGRRARLESTDDASFDAGGWDEIDFDFATIWENHRRLRDKYGDVLLMEHKDGLWVTFLNNPHGSSDAAKGWCLAHRPIADQCGSAMIKDTESFTSGSFV